MLAARPPLPISTVTVYFLLLLSAGCGVGHEKVASTSVELADRLTPAPATPAAETPSSRQSVFIDASLSMRGFVGRAASGSRTAFEEFIDAMPDVLPGCEVYQYGQAPRQAKPGATIDSVTKRAEFDSRLHAPDFYSLEFNPDDVLISGLVSEERPRLSIILTDGVESDSQGRVNTVVVESIRSWLGQGRIFAILPMRGRFSGNFYSELKRSMIGNVTSDSRPFYAFVFSPSRREFDDLMDKLWRRYAGLRPIVFSDDSIACRVGIPTTIDASYDHLSPPDKPYYWQMITTKKLRPDEEEPFAYRFTYDIKPTYPVKSLGVRLSPRVHRWDGEQGQFAQDGVPLPLDLQANTTSEGGSNEQGIRSVSFSLDPAAAFRSEAQSDFAFYAFEHAPYVQDVSDEVREATTRDDSVPANADKTYRFQELIYAVLDVHIKERLARRSSPRLYITSANR